MKVLVYGLGRSGLAVSRLLVRQGHEVTAFDARPTERDLEQLAALGGGFSREPLAVDAALCIAAPGVPYRHPHLEALRARGLETIGEVEWVYRSVDAPIIGITGTAGKTSVTQGLTQVLRRAGLDAVAGGNVDPALAAVAEPGRYLVTELSSFQLERCPTLRPRVAVALNLGVDHLDRHGSVAAYHESKFALTAKQTEDEVLVLNADDPRLTSWMTRSRARARRYALGAEADAHVSGDQLMLDGEALLPRSELPLPGKHQLGNALAIALAAQALGLEREAIAAGLKTLEAVPGRYARAGQVGGIVFIEDSIATRTLAVKAALEATPAPIVWLAGGVDKGAELEPLEALVRDKVRLLIGLGAAGPHFARAFEGVTQTLVIPEPSGELALRRACECAMAHLLEHHGGRGTVLLSPLGASFDQFENYQARAAAFRQAVAALEASREEAVWTAC